MKPAKAFEQLRTACRDAGLSFAGFRRAVCLHDPGLTGTEVTGATMSWSGGITREYQFNYECRKCGQLSSQGGFVIPGDRRLHPEAYNAKGWPIDEDGNKLKIK